MITEATKLGSDLIKHITEAQAIGSALAAQHREPRQYDSDDMEEDEAPLRTNKTLLSDSSTSSVKNTDAMDEDVIDISSNSSSESSSSSSSSSSDSTSSNDDSADSQTTIELTTRLLKNNAQRKQTTTKNNAILATSKGAPTAPKDPQAPELISGTSGDHLLPLDPSGGAGGLTKAAGPSD
jgi:cytoskeletal protein RodZ